MRKYIYLTTILVFLIPCIAMSANHYIRADATGSNIGTDWINAWTSLPATLTRGDTYYIADGSYNGYTFNDAVDGTKVITIKKAIESDHGTDTGWDSAYGDGTALFTAGLNFYTDYWVFDGQKRGSDWKSDYGFKIKLSTAGAKGIRLDDGSTLGASYITVRYTEIEHRGRNKDTADVGVYGDATGGKGIGNITMQYIYIHDTSSVPFTMRQWQTFLLEYSWIARNSSTAAMHSEGISDNGSDNVTIRYNYWEDIEGTAVIAIMNNSGPSAVAHNWLIYGNVIFHSQAYIDAGRGGLSGVIRVSYEGANQNKADGWRVYNNTIANIQGLWSGFRIDYYEVGQNNQAYNNLWYDSVRVAHRNIAKSHNWYSYGMNRDGDDNNVQIGSIGYVPFIDIDNMDFHLSAATNNGKDDLGSPYNEDMDGNIRGADGVWDRGAFEYDENTGLDAPSGLRIIN